MSPNSRAIPQLNIIYFKYVDMKIYLSQQYFIIAIT